MPLNIIFSTECLLKKVVLGEKCKGSIYVLRKFSKVILRHPSSNQQRILIPALGLINIKCIIYTEEKIICTTSGIWSSQYIKHKTNWNLRKTEKHLKYFKTNLGGFWLLDDIYIYICEYHTYFISGVCAWIYQRNEMQTMPLPRLQQSTWYSTMWETTGQMRKDKNY